jgi:Rrf2 family protein
VFSQTAEYALRAVVWMAMQPEEALTTQAIAQGTRVPASYLAKVMQGLGRAGLVQAQRGPHGGFRLSQPPQAISVLAVVNAVDPLQRIRSCPLHLPAHRQQLCRLHQQMDDALASMERALGAATIADMASPDAPV